MARIASQFCKRYGRQKLRSMIYIILLIPLYYICKEIYLSWLPYPLMFMVDKHTYDGSIYIHDATHWQNKTTKTVLIWTSFFADENWVAHFREGFGKSKYKCVATADKRAIKKADAVMFNYHGIGGFSSFPGYRTPNQVWVLTNTEPPPKILPLLNHLYINSLFNWTLTYRKDSTIIAPYGQFVPLTEDEKANFRHKNYAEGRTKMAAAIISDCIDNGRRYRIIKELGKYINIDHFGSCGQINCPKVTKPMCRASDYKFRIAFENNNCKDYVTEKFWNSLSDEVIPVVNWHKNQRPNIVPPKSFINVYDFKTVKDLGRYLNFVAENEEEFNKYFKWRENYKWDGGDIYNQLCSALHTPRPDQEIRDLFSWFHHDTCLKYSPFENYKVLWDRFWFDLGWLINFTSICTRTLRFLGKSRTSHDDTYRPYYMMYSQLGTTLLEHGTSFLWDEYDLTKWRRLQQALINESSYVTEKYLITENVDILFLMRTFWVFYGYLVTESHFQIMNSYDQVYTVNYLNFCQCGSKKNVGSNMKNTHKTMAIRYNCIFYIKFY